MEITIKHRFTNKILYEIEADTIKTALVRAVKEGADLQGAYLRGADLRGADLQGAYLRGADLQDAYLRGADLRGADLQDADLQDAYLQGADLRGADLRGADLRGAESYKDSHDFYIEIIRRQKIETFTELEWSIIGQISIHRLCWNSIKKRFKDAIIPIFKKLADIGFDEWMKYYEQFLEEHPDEK